MSEFAAALLSYLTNAWLHTIVALLAVLLAERSGLLRRWSSREAAWRLALILPLLSAALPLLPNMPALSWNSGVTSAISPDQPRPVRADFAGSDHQSAHPAEPREAAAVRSEQTASTPIEQTGVTLSSTLLFALLALWLLQFAVRGSLLASQWVALQVRSTALPRYPDRALQRVAGELSLTAKVASPTLVRDRAAGSPSVSGGAYLLLPDWIDELPQSQQRALLAHEVAHLQRGDVRWRLLLAARDCLLPLPYGTQIRRRLRDLAELQCDAWAAAQVDGRAVAESLASCAHISRSLPTPGLAAAMAESDSALVSRVRHLLEEKHMSHAPLSVGARCVLGTVVAITVFALPTVQLQAAAVSEVDSEQHHATTVQPDDDQGHTYRSSWDLDTPFGKRFSLTLKREDYELKIKAKGEFEIADDERGLSKVGRSLRINEQDGGLEQEVEFRNEGGRIIRTYERNRQQSPVDAQAQAWIGAMLGTILHETAINVVPRVARLHSRGGISAVLDEVAKIHSDYARAEYLLVTFSEYALSDAELDMALRLAAKTDSDYELRRVLVAAAQNPRINSSNLATVLRAAASLDSDYERRLLADAAAKRLPLDEQSLDAWFALTAALQSDYEKRVALVTFADRRDLPRPVLDRLITAMATLDSDYEARVALSELVPRAQSENLISAYAQATTQIASDYERGEALKSLLTDVTLDPAGTLAVLDAIAGIGSDYEKSSVLVTLAKHMPNDSELIAQYREIARGLGDHERGRAERALDGVVL